MTRVFDCFLVSEELDVLEYRLRSLGDVVSAFVIVEATVDHQGRTKPLYFSDSRERYGKWHDQIRHCIVELDSEGTPWDRERQQHRALETLLDDLLPDDLVMIGDCDEVPFAHVVRTLAATTCLPTRIHMRNAVYWANTVRSQPWDDGTMVFRWGDRGHPALALVRGQPEAVWRGVPDPAYVAHGGWHFGDLGDVDWLMRKVRRSSTTMLADTSVATPAHLAKCRAFGVDYRSGELLAKLVSPAIPHDVFTMADVSPISIRTQSFPALPLRKLYALFSQSRRWLPRTSLEWADRHAGWFLLVFGIPLVIGHYCIALVMHLRRFGKQYFAHRSDQ